MNILIADSGSTKTDWCLTDGTKQFRFTTEGINPFFQSSAEIIRIIQEGLGNVSVDEVFFYGAGCTGENPVENIRKALENATKADRIWVCDDLTGAARALCGRQPGIACILGTGSNSCQYDGKKIVRQIPPLGFILGDEGSGSVLGKRLVSDFLKNQMPLSLAEEFQKDFDTTQKSVLESVYRKPFPNRYLASFSVFLSRHISENYVQNILEEAFGSFFKRNVSQYDHGLPVHFTGSIAWYFRETLSQVAIAHRFTTGRFVKAPIDGLTDYHLHDLKSLH